jgi:hypothetical protein
MATRYKSLRDPFSVLCLAPHGGLAQAMAEPRLARIEEGR